MPDQFCIFCEIVAGRAAASVVYEDEHVMAFLDLFPVNEGHTLVIPKEHATYLNEMDAELGMRVFGAAHRLAQAVRDSGIRCDGVNLMLADGAVAGQEVFHVHLHVLPRYADDQFGFRFGDKSQVDRKELEVTAEKIRTSSASKYHHQQQSNTNANRRHGSMKTLEEETMASDKVTHPFEIESEQNDWLDEIAEEYSLQDSSKALRVLLDYAIQDGDADLIFAPENMRCRFCG